MLRDREGRERQGRSSCAGCDIGRTSVISSLSLREQSPAAEKTL